MAFLLELIPVLAEAIGVVGEGAAAVTEAAGAAVAETIPAVAEAAVAEGEVAATTTEAVFTAAEEAEGTATAGATAVRQAILKGAASFAQWAAKEIVKGAVFYAGMKSIEAIFHAIAASDPDDPATQEIATRVQEINDAVTVLHTTTDDWTNWSTAHYATRNTFGTVQVMGTVVSRFEVLENNLGTFGDHLTNVVAPALIAFNKSRTAADLEPLRVALLAYCQKIKGQADSIAENEKAMVAAGLQSHQAEVAQALADLS